MVIYLASNTPLAYLDPGSGSLLVQALVAGVAGTAVAAKLYWRRITSRFRRRRPTTNETDETS